MLWSAELGTRYLGVSKDLVAENKKSDRLAAQVSASEVELAKARSEAQTAMTERDEALQSSANLSSALAAETKLKDLSHRRAEDLSKQLEELRAQVEEQKTKAIEDFKESGEAQDWLAEAFQDGFEDAKAEVLKLHPDLDLSKVVFMGGAASESIPANGAEATLAEVEDDTGAGV